MLTSSQPSLPRDDASQLACETFAACSQNCCHRVVMDGLPARSALAGGGGGLSAQPSAATVAAISAQLGARIRASVACSGADGKAFPDGTRPAIDGPMRRTIPWFLFLTPLLVLSCAKGKNGV